MALGNELPHVTDVAGKFITFFDETSNLPISERVSRFHSQVVPAAPALYEDVLFKYSREIIHEDVDKRIAHHIEVFSQIRPRYEEIYRSLSADMTMHLNRFRKQFPDFNSDIVDVYLAHSLGGSNGAAVPVGNRTLFYLGIDMIATVNKFKNQEPFLITNSSMFITCKSISSENSSSASSGWKDCAYVTKQLQPQATNAELQTDDALIEETTKKLPELASGIDSILEVTDPQLNFKYFNVASRDKMVPSRSGYYVGYLAVKEIAKHASVKEMIEWQP